MRLCFGTFAKVLRICRQETVTDRQLVSSMTRTIDPNCKYIEQGSATAVSRLFSCEGNLSSGKTDGGSGAYQKVGENLSNVTQLALKFKTEDLIPKFQETVVPLLNEDKKSLAVLALKDIIKRDVELDNDSREKLYRLTNKLIRCFAEVKGDVTTASIADLCSWVEPKVGFYMALKETIGNASGDFIDLKSYEQDMRRLIDTYIRSEDSRKIGEFDDFTLLDFVETQGENLEGKNKESAAEAIENNIRKKVVEKILINPIYYENMSAILDELIKKRREGAIAYEKLLEQYIDLVKKSESPENNTRYPENIRHSSALRAFYDNCGEDEVLALALHQAVLNSKENQFRHNEFKERRIKKAVLAILKSKDEVERIYNIVVEQGEY